MNCSKDKKKRFQIWLKVGEGSELPVKIRMPSSSDLENKVLQELADALEMGRKRKRLLGSKYREIQQL